VLQFNGDPPTNLLYISLDTTRRDFIGRFAANGNTPNLDALLSTGVALDNHRSCSSWTAPSMTCATTGLSPFELGWWPWNSDPDVPNYDDEMPTLAGQLRFQKGFRTTLVTANNLFGPDFDRGFEELVGPYWNGASVVADDAIEQAQVMMAQKDPFYLHVHFIDPHGSYCPPDEFLEDGELSTLGYDLCSKFYDYAWTWGYQTPEWQADFLGDALEYYDAELDYWDSEFGRMWDALDAMGALDDTLVVFVTDHGEQFFERGGTGHGGTLYAEENRSTAMFWAKNIVPQAWTGATVHEDVAATIESYFGTKPEVPTTGTEVGLAPDDRFVRGLLYWGGGGQARLSIVRGQQQLTYDFWGEKHFWDYELDPTGTVDYYDPNDPDVIDFWVPMQEFVTDLLTKWPSAGPVTDPGP
jgi:arylsulfatase A-like enzyme